MSDEVKSFEDLKAYQACRDFRIAVIKDVVPKLVEQREFHLADQLKRSARSVTANMAEGYGRFHYADNAKFCSNARGSLCESLEHLITANDEGLLSPDLLQKLRSDYQTASMLLNGYISYLYRAQAQNKTKGQVRPQPQPNLPNNQ